MLNQFQKRLELVDKWILIPFLMLIVSSVLIVYSASSYVSQNQYGYPTYYLLRQGIFALMGIFAFLFATLIPLKIFRSLKLNLISVGIMLAMLAYLLFFGEDVLGASRWIATPFFNIQPAEFAKLVIIFYLAYILDRRQNELLTDDWTVLRDQLKKPTLLVGAITLLILVQPDTGTTFIVFLIVLSMLAASGVSLKYGFGFLGLTFGGMIFLFLFLRLFGQYIPFLGYRYQRFLGLWNPFEYADTHGHQLVNSYYALARGGIFGVGIGNSVQKTGYLPFPHTDFIVSIIGEELGLVGVFVMVGLLALMITRTYRIANLSHSTFDSLLCIGIATMLLTQSLVNLSGVVGILPITGVTFPLLSYGGSSLLVVSFSLGLVANVSIRQHYATLYAKKREVKQ